MTRQKITEAPEQELPKLTHKQHAYVIARLGGKNQSDAYREAYDAEKLAPESLWVCASRVEHNAKVALWLDAARQAGQIMAECTLEGHLAELERLKRQAVASGNYGAAVQAEQLRGKASGFYKERMEIDDKRQSTQDIVERLRTIARTNPELAEQLAYQSGVDPAEVRTEH